MNWFSVKKLRHTSERFNLDRVWEVAYATAFANAVLNSNFPVATAASQAIDIANAAVDQIQKKGIVE